MTVEYIEIIIIYIFSRATFWLTWFCWDILRRTSSTKLTRVVPTRTILIWYEARKTLIAWSWPRAWFTLCRICPSFVWPLVLLVFRERVRHFCTNYNACLILNEEARFFTLISILFQFYILLLYNRNFRESFFDLLERF